MNNNEFDVRLDLICQTLFNSGFLKDNKKPIFSPAELAQMQVQLAQVAVNATLAMNEADMRKEQLGVEIKKVQTELELAIARSKLENVKIMADSIASAVQAESIKRSVTDNAAINKTNAFVSYFNVAMNAIANNSASLDEGGALSNISEVVLNSINEINTTPLGTAFDDLLTMLTNNAKKLENIGDGTKKVTILAPKTIIARGEPLTLMGLSIFGDNESEWCDGEVVEKSRFYTLVSEEAGKREIIFRVKDNKGEWVEDRIHIAITKRKFKKGGEND